MTRIFGEDDKLDLEYPVSWSYKVVGQSEERVREAIAGIVGALEHSVTPSNKSRTGKYVSLELVVTVIDEGQRLGIGQALHEHADVKFVL